MVSDYLRKTRDSLGNTSKIQTDEDLANDNPCSEHEENIKPKAKTNSYAPKIRMTTMNTVDRMKPDFTIPGWIPRGSVSLGYGEGGIGKSTVILDWAASLSTGRNFHNITNSNEIGDTVLILAEDSLEYTVSPRLDAVGADDSRIHVIDAVEFKDEYGDKFDTMIDIATHKDLINDALSSVENPQLLVVDPIGSFIKGDMYRDNEVRQTIAPLADIAEKHQIAVVMIAHDGKDERRGAKNRFLGSVAFRNAARSAFWFTEDPDDEERKLIFHTKSNLGPMMPPMAYRLVATEHEVAKVEWCSDAVELSADEVIGRRLDHVKKPKRAEAKEFIRETLEGGSWHKVTELDELAKDAGIAPKTLSRAKTELKETGELQWDRDGESKEWYVKIDSNLTTLAF